MFGLSPEEIEAVGVPVSMGVLMLYMGFIVWNLAKESKAGKVGTFVLFFVLTFGMIGFVAKSVIAKLLGI
jgi:hypothetical protein